MPMTTTSDVSFDQVAYDLRAFFALRSRLYFDAVADVKPTEQAHPGASVTFTIVNDLAPAITPLTETVDVNPVAMSDQQVTLALAEFGNAVTTTARLRGTSFIPFDPIVANVIGFNAALSLDTVARNVLAAGTNVAYATGGATTPTSRATVQAEDVLAADDVRTALARLVAANVMDIDGAYVAFVHPNVEYDLKRDSDPGGWLQPSNYSQPENRWNGEIGMFEGFRFVRTPQAPVFAGAGDSGTDVYGSLFVGAQALAKAYSIADGNGEYPRTVPGPVTDTLRRFVPMGWYWLGQYGVFRQASLWRVESSASI